MLAISLLIFAMKDTNMHVSSNSNSGDYGC